MGDCDVRSVKVGTGSRQSAWRRRSRAGFVEQINDLPSRAGFAPPREDSGDAIDVRVKVHVGHGVDREGDFEPRFVRVACGRLDAFAGGDAGDNDLGDPQIFQLRFEIRIREGSPLSLPHCMVVWLLFQFGDDIGPVGR